MYVRDSQSLYKEFVEWESRVKSNIRVKSFHLNCTDQQQIIVELLSTKQVEETETTYFHIGIYVDSVLESLCLLFSYFNLNFLVY